MDRNQLGYNKRFSYEYVKSCFDERGYDLITNEYLNSLQKLEYRCRKHSDVIQYIIFQNFRAGRGCRICAGNYPVKTMEYANKLLESKNIEIRCIEYSGGCGKPSLMKCPIDGYEWRTSLDKILNGRRGCPKCSRRILYKTADNINKRLCEIGITTINCLTFDGSVLSNKSKLECNVCGYQWLGCVGNIMYSDHGCPRCSKRVKVKTKDEANQVLEKLDCGIVCLDYIGTVAQGSTFLCLNCNKSWKTSLNNINNGTRCPYCLSSKGESAIANWLDVHEIEYMREYRPDGCSDIRSLRFDFYIKTNDGYFLCEYNGEQHYFPTDFGGKGKEWARNQFRTSQRRDNIKKKYCIENSIDLLIIPYTQFSDIPNILQEKLLS